MRKANWLYFFFFLIPVVLLVMPDPTKALPREDSDWFLSQINVPGNLTPTPGKKIIVAIVDDGIRITHHDLRDFIWQNPFEIPNNSIDDDGNGVADDIHGWDVADNNNTVSPPPDRIQEYFHGTHLAGIIARIARAAYGARAAEAITIMPVKSLADNAPDTAIRDGYKGIEYAARTGANIVLCAWNVAHISADEEKILQKARDKGVLIIAAAGNFPEEREQYPAADNAVFAVTALNKANVISTRSNYGSFVDLSAPGVDIVSTSSLSDEASAVHEGTSQAAAIVAGSAAVMMAQSPSSSIEKIITCLKNGSSLLKPESSEYAAKQGAGLLNISDSIACLKAGSGFPTTFLRPQGYLNLAGAKAGTTAWTIQPPGEFKGIWFTRPEMQNENGQISIDFSTDNTTQKKSLAHFPLAAMPDRFFVPGTQAIVTIQTDTGIPQTQDLLMEYRAESIKFRTLYCKDTIHLSEPGDITDRSGDAPYAANSDCKWQINAPEGKVIHFKFTEFDTEPNTDLLYFFNGSGTHEKIMAIFSGQNIPPELTTWENKVLVWFVTNGENQGQGWQGEFTFIDKDKAQYPTPPKAEQ